jgi:transposase
VPRKKRQYTAEFKQAAVELVLARNLSIAQAARDLDVGQSLLGTWVGQARAAAAPTGDALSAEERTRLRQLEREVAILREEREILKKAAAFFAKEAR